MEKKKYNITVGNETKEFEEGTTYQAVAKEFCGSFSHPAVLAVEGENRLQELRKTVEKDCELKFITTADAIGHETYKRSLCFLLVKAVHDVAGHDKIERVRIHFSVDIGYYCTVDGDIKLQSSSLRMWRSGCVGSQMKKFRLKRRQFIQMMRSNYFTDMECMIRKNYLNTGGFQK